MPKEIVPVLLRVEEKIIMALCGKNCALLRPAKKRGIFHHNSITADGNDLSREVEKFVVKGLALWASIEVVKSPQELIRPRHELAEGE